MPTHVVAKGEVLEVIARRHGTSAAAIRHAAENATLFETRSANVLFAGDEVFVPDDAPKSVMLEPDRVHTFVYRPRTQRVAFRFCRAGVPRRHEPVEWSVDGSEATATHLDHDGWLRVNVPLGAGALRVVFDPGTDVARARSIRLGHLDPHVEAVGVQQRLNNLGFECGAEDGDVAEKTQAALALFQAAHGLEASGTMDADTCVALAGRHGV